METYGGCQESHRLDREVLRVSRITDQVDIGFDGDEVNQFLHIDRVVSEEMINLAPHKSAFNFSGVREVSVNISMPKPVIATIAAFIKRNDEPIDYERRARAEAFFA